MSETRTIAFQKNNQLESLLAELNSDLQPSEKLILERSNYQQQLFPLVLVMGPMRSGTTLFMQWLANTGIFAYPTNLLSRFYQAPIIGSKVQLLLTDPRYNFRNELGEFINPVDYTSENGKTAGALAPNEFWYFWRRFLQEPQRDVWSDEELRQSMDTVTLTAELSGIMDVFQKPFAAKGMLFNYNIPFLDSLFDRILFIQLKRDPATNVASVLDARKRQLGHEDQWYSFKIPEFSQLKDLDTITQAAGQVHYINKAVTKGLEQVDESRKITVQYEDFCRSPETVYLQLTDKLKLGTSVPKYCGPDGFKLGRSVTTSTVQSIKKALDLYQL